MGGQSLSHNMGLSLKHIVRSAYGRIPLRMRLSRKFFQTLAELEQRQWWPSDRLRRYQNERLRLLIRHAYTNVPYYNELFKKCRLKPNDIQTVDDLPKIPILRKDDIRTNLSKLRAVNYTSKEVSKNSTSGTTGAPLVFYDHKSPYRGFNGPFIWRFFRWTGLDVNQKRATLSEWTLAAGKSFYYNPVYNLLILSAYRLNKNTAKEYLAGLAKHRIEYISGYPASIELFTSFLKGFGIKPPVQLKAIITHSEYLSDWMRRSIEDFWGCRCFDWYGMTERVVLGVECEEHQGHHLCSDYGITEFIDEDPDGYSRIIATGLTNYIMPFIRYDTGDVGYLKQEECSCGRGFPLFILKGGRKRNFAIAKDGSYIPVANIDIPKVSDNVSQFQFAQEIPGRLCLQIVKKDAFSDKDTVKIRSKLFEKFSDNMDIELTFVNGISRTANNKTPLFVQRIENISSAALIQNGCER